MNARIARAVFGLLLLAACGDDPLDVVDVRFDSDGKQVAVIRAEVAETREQQSRGLMDRESMLEDAGMLFIFDEPLPRSFWMKDTLIPLDLIVIRDGRVIQVASMVPCRTENCPTTAIMPADAALEVNAGVAARAGIIVGSLVDAGTYL